MSKYDHSPQPQLSSVLQVAGLIGRKQRILAATHGVDTAFTPVFPEAVTARFRTALDNYYDAVVAELTKEHKAWQKAKAKSAMQVCCNAQLHGGDSAGELGRPATVCGIAPCLPSPLSPHTPIPTLRF